MTENKTVENLLDHSSAIEKEMVTFYCRMRRIFSHMPEAEELWTRLRDDEITHIIQLDQIKESLSPDQLAAPADRSMIEQAERVLKFMDPERWEEIGDLDDAVELANAYENSEANRIFSFLAERYIARADRKKFIEAIINEHLERLISLPAGIDASEARKRIPAKKIQL